MAEAIIKVRDIAVQPTMAVGASEPMFKGPSYGLADQPLPETPFWYNELPSPALNDPRIFPQMEVYRREPVPETPSSSTESDFVIKTPSPHIGSESLPETHSPNTASYVVPELKRCSSCRKWLSKRHYLLVGGKFAATCEHCRATKRPYHVSFATLTSPTQQLTTSRRRRLALRAFTGTRSGARRVKKNVPSRTLTRRPFTGVNAIVAVRRVVPWLLLRTRAHDARARSRRCRRNRARPDAPGAVRLRRTGCSSVTSTTLPTSVAHARLAVSGSRRQTRGRGGGVRRRSRKRR